MANSKEDDCTKKPCKSRRNENLPANDDPNANIYGRPLLYAGVLWIGVVKNILIPSSCRQPSGTDLTALGGEEPRGVSHSHAASVVGDQGEDDHGREKDRPKRKAISTQTVAALETSTKSRQLDGVVLGGDQAERLSSLADLLRDMQQQMQRLTDETILVLNDSRYITAEALERVRGEDGAPTRFTAIAVSGLVGYAAALRRGAVARAAYAASAALAAAVVCYPRKALEYDVATVEVVGDAILSGVEGFRIPGFPGFAPNDSGGRDGYPEKFETAEKLGPDQRFKDAKTDPAPQTPPPSPAPVRLAPRRDPPSEGPWPYSPALPAPPKTTRGPGDEGLARPPRDVHTATQVSNGVIERHFSDGEVEVFVRVVTDAEHDSDIEDDEELAGEDDIEEDVGGVEETVSEWPQQGGASHNYPLNSKLIGYYRRKEEEEIPYLDKGNEDLYVKRR